MISLVVFVALGVALVNAASIQQLNSRKPIQLGNSNVQCVSYEDVIYRDPEFQKQKALAFVGKRQNVRDPYQDEAMKLWLTKEFYNQYAKWSVVQDQNQINHGKQVFNSIKLESHTIKSSTGVYHDMPVDNIRGIVDLWYKQQLIIDATRQELNLALDSTQFNKASRGNAGVNQDQEVTFYQIGYATTDIFANKKGALAYSFYTVKFKMGVEMHTEKTQNCVLWGLWCETKYTIKLTNRTLTGEESIDLAAYLRQEGLNNFYDDNIEFIERMQRMANQFKPFLPKSVQDDVTKMDQNSGTRPDKIFNEDPLDGNKLPWSQARQ